MKRIYLDNNATTGLDPRVLHEMLPFLSSTPANPSSSHFFGQEARSHLSKAHQSIAQFFHVKPSEIIFTSGGTESLNLLLRGFYALNPRAHVITSDVEHSAVYKTLDALTSWEVTSLPAGLWGAVRPEEIASAIRPETKLIVLGAANSETGVKHDIEAIAHLAKQNNIPFIVDAVALLGKELFLVPDGVSAMAFSGHKLHAPKGTGLALIRSSFKIAPQITGGDQEYSKRGGTENLAGIIGLAKAIDLLNTELPDATERMRQQRDRFEMTLIDELDPVLINGRGPRTVNTSNLAFPDVDGEALLMQLDLAGIAVSHGSACSSGALEPSRVLQNMGLPKKIARSAIRFSLSRMTTDTEIDQCLNTVIDLVKKLRKIL